MPTIEWSESFSVGVRILDEDHKRLIDIINRVGAARVRNESISWVLEELFDYARHHFMREETMLADSTYPELERHRGEHKRFLDWLQSLQSSFRAVPDAQFQFGGDVEDYLVRWLTEHILVDDMSYKGLVRDP